MVVTAVCVMGKTYKVIKIHAKCILALGLEVNVSHWDVRTLRPSDLASKEVLLGVWL